MDEEISERLFKLETVYFKMEKELESLKNLVNDLEIKAKGLK